MLLSAAEAAQLLRQSERTVRARLARGELPGRKQGGRWLVPREALPLPAAEHDRIRARADAIRATVDAALPSRLGERRRRSAVDEPAFRAAHALAAGLRAADQDSAPVELALADLTIGLHEWHPDGKRAAFLRARAGFSRAFVAIATQTGLPPTAPHAGWLAQIEDAILPALAGLLKQAERRR